MKSLYELLKLVENIENKARLDEIVLDKDIITRKLTNLLVPGKVSRGKAQADKATNDIFNEWLTYKGRTASPQTFVNLAHFLKMTMGMKQETYDLFVDMISPEPKIETEEPKDREEQIVEPIQDQHIKPNPAYVTQQMIHEFASFNPDTGNFKPLNNVLKDATIYNIIAEFVRISMDGGSQSFFSQAAQPRPKLPPTVGKNMKQSVNTRKTVRDVSGAISKTASAFRNL